MEFFFPFLCMQMGESQDLCVCSPILLCSGVRSLFEQLKSPQKDPPFYEEESSDSGEESDSCYPDPLSVPGPELSRSSQVGFNISSEMVPYTSYGLRVPPGPFFTGLFPLYNACGTLGYLDPSSGFWYYASADNGYVCTPLGVRDSYVCGLPPASCGHCHSVPNAQVFLDLRYRVVLRAFAAGRRSGLTRSELNNFAIFAYRRIFKSSSSFRPFKRVPEFLHGCSRTGFIFPGDRALYHPSAWPDGLMHHPIPVGIALIEFITQIECVHFGYLDRVAPHVFGHEVRLWCPYLASVAFPERHVPYAASSAKGGIICSPYSNSFHNANVLIFRNFFL